MRLHELLDRQREALMRRWTDEVRALPRLQNMPQAELKDHLPTFVTELAQALGARASSESSPTAAMHGVQRLRLGFDLGDVVREYGILRNCIVELARDNAVEVDRGELQVLFDGIVAGIADAVSEYSRQRDAALQRQASEHFAFVAHELRNPLQSARMALAMLQKGRQLPEGRPATVLLNGLEQMNTLIESSLRLARAGAGIELRPGPVRLRKLLADIEAASAVEAEQAQVAFRSVAEGDPTLVVDTRLIRSAIDNLARNAVKFTHRGGSVEVRARVAGSRAIIEVEDECGGLPAGFVEQAFAPFVKADETKDGFGLGLAIAKQAVDAHGGTIRVQNLPGKGCIFVLELPGVVLATPA